MAQRWHYSGDVNIEHGGVFYCLDAWDNWGYADYVRCQPCSDAGMADNQFWIERGTVNHNFDSKEWVETKFKPALECCGQTLDGWRALRESPRRHMAFECLLSYGLYEQDQSIAVELGPYFYGDKLTDVVKLRANTNLRTYVRRICTEGFPR